MSYCNCMRLHILSGIIELGMQAKNKGEGKNEKKSQHELKRCSS